MDDEQEDDNSELLSKLLADLEPELEPEPQVQQAPSLDDLIAEAAKLPIVPSAGRKAAKMDPPMIARNAALGVLRLLIAASNNPSGGTTFNAADIQSANPELAVFNTANTVGTYCGFGLVVNKKTVEKGLNLPRVSGHSPSRFAPCREAAGRSLAKLRGQLFTFDGIARAVGLADEAELIRRLKDLPSFTEWLATRKS